MEVPESNHEFKVVDDDENRKYQSKANNGFNSSEDNPF